MEHITNEGKGRAVVLVHGNSLSNGIWRPQIEDPALNGLNLLAVDLPGHGRGDWLPPGAAYSLDGYATELAGLVRGLPDPVLVGHSLGGHICMRVLAKAPNVRGLMLLGAPPLASAADMMRAFLPTPAMDHAFKPDLTEEEARTSAAVYTWPGSPWIEPMTAMIMKTDPRVRADMGRELMSGNLADELALIRASGVPVCMVQGSEEASISPGYLNELASLFWERRVRVLEGCGHSPQLQRPDDFTALLRGFMEGI
ncbi:MAG: alpha/beta hydrolase [Flavobacteriales bacterium]|nr:alpha/beta hydrolase [Flavobacteriales bacterium]